MFAYERLRPFQRVTGLAVRDYGRERPSHAHLWLEGRQFDQDLVEHLLEAFEDQAAWIASHLEKNGKDLPGERLFTSLALKQPNYLFFIWERTAYGATRDDAQIPTASEMWSKAAFAALLLAGLTGCKVYVTERPYLPISDPAAIKPTVVLDGPHNILRGVLRPQPEPLLSLPERDAPRVSTSADRSAGPASTSLIEGLDLLAALWQINSDYGTERERRRQGKAKDKHVAERLEELTHNPLAGAHFYKQYSRLPEEPVPHGTYARACEVLLERRGGELMEIVKELASRSMELFLPYPQYGRGKAHTYELVFREAMDAIRKAPAKSREELQSLAAGTLLKGLERRWLSRRGEGIVNPDRGDLNQMVGNFVGMLIGEVLEKRANGSMAAFNRLANSLADGIYYEIDRQVAARMADWRKQVEARKAARAGSSSEGK